MLVVVGILAALVAALVPVCAGVRQSAHDVVCAARLRDLSFACASYLHDCGTYPDPVQDFHPLPAASSIVLPTASVQSTLQPMPQNNQTRLINDLGSYLRFPKVASGAAAVDLPPAVQCPCIEAVEAGRGPVGASDVGNCSYYTGYDYLAGLDGAFAVASPVTVPVAVRGASGGAGGLSKSNPSGSALLSATLLSLIPGVVLKPGRASGLRGGRRAVIWADDVRLDFPSSSLPASSSSSSSRGAVGKGVARMATAAPSRLFWLAGQPGAALPPGAYWVFAHSKRGAASGPVPLSAAEAAGCRGQHLAYTDNSVEWQKADNIGLPASIPASGPPAVVNALLDPSASFKSGSTYWWY